MGDLVYFSSRSENTRRFVEKLGRNALRLPLDAADEPPQVEMPDVLVTPSYGGGGSSHTG